MRRLPRPKGIFESDHWGADSSEPQVVTAQLVDGPAAHQLHVAFDFAAEVSQRPLDARLAGGGKREEI
jgi:hypothetical protein